MTTPTNPTTSLETLIQLLAEIDTPDPNQSIWIDPKNPNNYVIEKYPQAGYSKEKDWFFLGNYATLLEEYNKFKLNFISQKEWAKDKIGYALEILFCY